MRGSSFFTALSSFVFLSLRSRPVSPFRRVPEAGIYICLSLRFQSALCAVNFVDPYDATDASDDHQQVAGLPRRATAPNQLGMQGKRASLSSKDTLKYYSSLLHDCVSKETQREGRAVHGNLIRNEFELDLHLWVSLVSSYAKCGGVTYARKLLDLMRLRDVVSWTAVISGFVALECGFDAILLFRQMRREGIAGNDFTLSTALKACCKCLDFEFGIQVHAEATKLGFISELFVSSALVKLYATCSEMEVASSVFFTMPTKNVVAWNVLLNGYAEKGDAKGLWNLLYAMKEPEMKFNEYTLSTVLKGCAISANASGGMMVHSLVVRIGFDEYGILSSALIDMYSKCGQGYEALKIFESIEHPDIVAWSSMIACLDKHELAEESATFFNLMRQSGIRPNQFTFASILGASQKLGNYYGGSIHACILKHGDKYDNLVGNALITMYMQHKLIESGIQVFYSMTDRDEISWNALLSGFCYHETCDQGPQVFYKMLREGFKPTADTFLSIFKSCSNHSSVALGKQIHTHVVKSTFSGDTFVQTALMDMYAKTGALDDAALCFHRLVKKDIRSWTVIICGYAQSNHVIRSVEYFIKMQQEGLKPNEFTFSACLNGCAHMKALQIGCVLHSLVIKLGYGDDMIVASAITDLYGKCGSLKDAEAVFERLASRDTVSWNTMICLYTRYGNGEKALQTFRRMVDEGIVPDGVSFTGVISACSGTCLIEEATSAFEQYGMKILE